jgi:hypothetical protein
MADRADIFDADLDLSQFSPKKAAPAAPPEAVRKVAEAAAFTSRESAPKKRPARVHRTGRNMQLTAKVTEHTLDDVYSISEAQDWVLGETPQDRQ